MTAQSDTPEHGNPYNVFILVLTVLSLVIMALLILPLDEATLQVLRVYDNAICVVFLIDFAGNLAASHPRRDYLVGRRGWIDLLGSIPTFGIFPATALLRLFRISRLARITRILRGKNQKQLVEDVVRNRSQYAVYITILSAITVLVFSSVLVLQFESRSPDANITTGGDALWWAVVTITTVGYGDQYPVTTLGRLTGVVVMAAGVGIIGALASILASILVPSPASGGEENAATADGRDSAKMGSESPAVASELSAIRAELAALRASLAAASLLDKPQVSADR